jgi:acetyl/propionyl-CoA carboxylase alpha subunit
LQAANGWELRHQDHAGPARSWTNPDGTRSVALGGEVRRFSVSNRIGEVEVVGSGGHWLMRIGPRPPVHATTNRKASDGVVIAPLPATVLKVHVNEGDAVTPGQPMVTLYAMKMELVCDSHLTGVVAAVNCSPGDLVDHDQVLARVEPQSGT